MRKEIILPVIALAGGGAGFALRRWELATAFESGTGLPIAGAPATWALVGFTVAVAAVLALLCRGLHEKAPAGLTYDRAFAAKGNTLYMAALAAAALLMVAAAAITGMSGLVIFRQESVGTSMGHALFTTLPRLLLCALSACSAVCLLALGKNNYRGEGHGKFSAALLIPSYTCCLWLIVAYQARSGDPVVLDYVWELFAIMAAVLGTYFMAGFAFERAKVFRCTWLSLMGIYFTLVTLADSHEFLFLPLYAAMLLYLGAAVTALLFNLQRPLGPRMPGRRLSDDTNDDQEGNPDEG